MGLTLNRNYGSRACSHDSPQRMALRNDNIEQVMMMMMMNYA